MLCIDNGSISRLEFLEAKIEWQDKMIKDLEGEHNFLCTQVLGLKKKSKDVSMSEDDTSQSPADLSDSSDSDVVIPKRSNVAHGILHLQMRLCLGELI
ncbi:hypothetical protein CgunFtcFv8_011338 [Champsocephalus gunnari]|uniref:Uncharacterized protein n=1 Tax=Champsocephalus gunnari TaxID=52237 RepID=A0AAN8D7S3_CHAGU|nr:hypothetical protein CgunFtcFv8_011338 [Champsocephalus gunnari]